MKGEEIEFDQWLFKKKSRKFLLVIYWMEYSKNNEREWFSTKEKKPTIKIKGSQSLTKPYGWTMMSGWQRYQLVFVGLSLCSPWAHVLYYFTFGYSLKPKYK